MTTSAGLAPGTRLGVYEVLASLGEGGMGAVYRALDTRLKRDVAIKVLLPEVANDPERLARFQREAEVLASLNHPNIAHIYGLEGQEGREGGVGHAGQVGPFLVLELVEGPTLAERIADARGGLPLDDALKIARQIAEALDAAHDRDIIHRDLKPANIKVTDDGTVKVLDFGLAKAFEKASGNARVLPPNATGIPGSPGLVTSPTLTSPALMTGVGVLLGTAAYMAPEQARGRAVDKRADIWAFGCVLYEMLTGERAFAGDDITDTLAAIVRDQPDLAKVPQSVQRLLRKCFEKDPKQRLRDLGDAWELLDDVRVHSESNAIPASTRAARRLAWVAFGVAGIAVTAGVFAVRSALRAPAPPVTATAATWLTATLPADVPLFVPNIHRGIAITPDGSEIVYTTRDGLAVRHLNSRGATLLPGTVGARAPFISMDGTRVGFVNDTGQPVSTPVRGGPTESIIRGPLPNGQPNLGAGGFLGGAFLPDGGVVFSAGAVGNGLVRVEPDGRQSSSLTSPDQTRSERSHQWPVALPNGRGVLFTIMSGPADRPVFEVAALDLASGKYRVIVRGSQPEYLDGGYCTFVQDGKLFGASFDAARLELTSPPASLIDDVATVSLGAAYYSVSRSGSLAFLASPVDVYRSFVWRDHAGRETPIPAPRGNYIYPRLSPDGARIAVDTRDNNAVSIGLYDMKRDVLTRLPLSGAGAQYPLWQADSRRIYYGRAEQLWSQSVDGGAAIGESVGGGSPLSLDRSQSRLVMGLTTDGVRWLGLVKPGAQQQMSPLLRAAPASITNGEISPDGRFLAFQSSEPGRWEIFVVPFPDVTAARWQVSSDGGTRPAWSRDGKELFFLDASGGMMRVPVTVGQTFATGTPEKLFDAVTSLAGFPPGRNYDVAADGRFLMVKDGFLDAPHPLALTVALNWVEDVKAKVGKKP